MKKYKIGLVIGRFQPFHNGHVYLFEKAFDQCERIIIGVGSANRKNKNNPWSANERRLMLERFVNKNGYSDRVIKIVNLDDNPDDDVWFENLYKKTGPFDVTLGNNEWNNEIIKRHGIAAIYTGLHNREEFEGYRIRALMLSKKSWKSRVPQYLASLIRAL
jgi:nicotinamide-nucleotide adenylyltransferase